MTKLIGMDFDGTLLNDQKEVTELTKETLSLARRKGIKIVGVTARPLESTEDVLDITMFDYLILNNGAYVLDIVNNKTLEKTILPADVIKEITDTVKEKVYQIDYCTENKYYIYKGKPVKGLSFIKTVNSYEDVPEDICRMNIFLDKEIINDLTEKLKYKYLNLHIFIMQDSDSDKQWIVVNPNNLNKLKAIIKLAKSLGISNEEITFFGDGLNDLEIIEYVGDGVAMGNALPKIKEKAKHITLSNNDSGIAFYIKNNILK